MGFIGFGLVGIIAGIVLLADGSGAAPTTWSTYERFGLLVLVAGVVAVLVGIVVQVVSVERADRRGP